MKYFALLVLFFSVTSFAETNPDDLQKIYSPYIQGDVLVIKGRIDSHIYDYFAREAKALQAVTTVDLNSLGGNTEWALMVSEKIKVLKLNTLLRKGNFCASACTYLFAGGKTRTAEKETWFGIHGVRLGAGYITSFQGLCFIEMEDGTSVFEPRMKGCQDFLNKWYAVTLDWTNKGFDFMESNGVSKTLRTTYFSMPDDENWPEQLNVLKKPDWFLTVEEAVKYDFVTSIK
jgi:hypothetical protein